MKFYSHSTARSLASAGEGRKLGCEPGVTVTLAIQGGSCYDLELPFIEVVFVFFFFTDSVHHLILSAYQLRKITVLIFSDGDILSS